MLLNTWSIRAKMLSLLDNNTALAQAKSLECHFEDSKNYHHTPKSKNFIIILVVFKSKKFHSCWPTIKELNPVF